MVLEKIMGVTNLLPGAFDYLIHRGLVVLEKNIVDNKNIGLDGVSHDNKKEKNYKYSCVQVTLENKYKKDIVLNKAFFIINSVEEHREYDLRASSIFDYSKQEIRSYIINNGNLFVDDVNICLDLTAIKNDGTNVSLGSKSFNPVMNSASVLKLDTKDVIDDIRHMFQEELEYSELIINMSFSGEPTKIHRLHQLIYNRNTNTFNENLVMGMCMKEAAVVVFDPKSDKKKYEFNSLNLRIGSTSQEIFNLVIIPLSSCELDFDVSFEYEGKEIRDKTSRSNTTIIKVPMFNIPVEQKVLDSKMIINKLEEHNKSEYTIGEDEIIDKYIGYSIERTEKEFVDIRRKSIS